MFDELKKKSLKSSLLGTIILLIVGVALTVFLGAKAFSAAFGYTTFEDLAPDEIHPGQLVEANVVVNFGSCIEEYEYQESAPRATQRTTSLYYVIWTRDGSFNDDRYLAIKVPAKYKSQMEDMYENTAAGYYSDPITLSGEVKKLNEEELRYFKEYFVYDDGTEGFTEAEYEQITLPYYINVYASKASMNAVFLIGFAGGVVCLIFGILRIVKATSGGYLKKLRQDIVNAGYSESYVESDYASATSITKNGSIKVGRLMTYYSSGATMRAFANKDIVWAYQSTTTHRTNGIKTGTTYSSILYLRGQKSAVTLSMPNEATTQEFLKRVGTMFPWAVVGYSEDLRRLFFKEYQQFLDLRFNTMEHNPVEVEGEGFTNPQ